MICSFRVEAERYSMFNISHSKKAGRIVKKWTKKRFTPFRSGSYAQGQQQKPRASKECEFSDRTE
jgi:hypothetical protein